MRYEYLTLREVALFERGCMNHKLRKLLLFVLNESVWVGDIDEGITFKMIEWLYRRKIYLKYINIRYTRKRNCITRTTKALHRYQDI